MPDRQPACDVADVWLIGRVYPTLAVAARDQAVDKLVLKPLETSPDRFEKIRFEET